MVSESDAAPNEQPEPQTDAKVQRRLPQEAQDNVDLADIVDTVEMIGELIQPYARIVATLRWLIGWESVYWSGSVLAGLVIGCIFCPGLLLCGLAAGPAIVMTLARFRRIPEGRGAYFDPVWQVSGDAHARATTVPDQLEATNKTLQKYYTYLLHFQSTADEFCEWLIDNHKLWNWTEPARSIRLITSCMVVTLALLFLPTNYGLAAITCLIFYGGWEPSNAGVNPPEVYPSVYQQQQGQADDTDGSGWVHVNDDPSLLRDRNVSNGSGGGGSGSGANSLLDYDATVNNGSDSPDDDHLKQKKKNGNVCARPGCKVVFSFFRKRVYCRHCGQQFCGSCCSSKVPRSYFGATAPAAQKETVRVCKTCKQYLGSQASQQPALI